jgi:hypothetical protein
MHSLLEDTLKIDELTNLLHINFLFEATDKIEVFVIFVTYVDFSFSGESIVVLFNLFIPLKFNFLVLFKLLFFL